jgi:ubiquinone/menaquinone biosynthesis C-methylase UbiE
MSDQHFDDRYGSNVPENYERFFVSAIGKPLAEDLIRLAEIRPGEGVLDVACGTGIVARLAYEKIAPNGSVSGLDVNPGMLAMARSISPDTSIEWYEASAEAMPLPDNAFDVVLCQMGLQFMEDKLVALQEMRRVLAPSGRLILNLPGPAAEVFAIMANAMQKNINAQAAGFVNHVFSLYDTKEIQQLMSEAGLENIDIQLGTKTLHLPAPKDFLWQYVYSTPLSAVVLEADDNSRTALEKEVVDKWQKFVDNGTMKYVQPMVTAFTRAG